MDAVATAKLRAAFASYDHDKDLALNWEEFRALAQETDSLSPTEIIETFQFLTGNVDTSAKIAVSQFCSCWSNTNTNHSAPLQKLVNTFSKRQGIFFGFTYDEYYSKTELDPTQVFTWNVSNVLLSIATSPQLQVCRSYLQPDNFKDVDGETLVALNREDLLEKGIKTYHTNKFLRYISSLQFAAQNPSHSLHANPEKRKSLG